MKLSQLAERIAEYDASADARRITRPRTRTAIIQDADGKPPRRPGRAMRARGIRTSDQGLKTFRVC